MSNEEYEKIIVGLGKMQDIMKVDVSDILDCMDRDSKLTLINLPLKAIMIKQDTTYDESYLLFEFQGGKSIKMDVMTMPFADTAYRFEMINRDKKNE
jgi:hypothetical protein